MSPLIIQYTATADSHLLLMIVVLQQHAHCRSHINVTHDKRVAFKEDEHRNTQQNRLTKFVHTSTRATSTTTSLR